MGVGPSVRPVSLFLRKMPCTVTSRLCIFVHLSLSLILFISLRRTCSCSQHHNGNVIKEKEVTMPWSFCFCPRTSNERIRIFVRCSALACRSHGPFASILVLINVCRWQSSSHAINTNDHRRLYTTRLSAWASISTKLRCFRWCRILLLAQHKRWKK